MAEEAGAAGGGRRVPGLGLARRLPRWSGSIRFRLAVLYSVLLFGLAAIVVGGIYAGLANELEDQPVSRTEQWVSYSQTPEGLRVDLIETETLDILAAFEKAVNTRALEQLRSYTFAALGLLFVASLGVGWYVSGLVLRPIGRITSVARDIQATDLKRRIDLKGPDDELKRLADTFDGMLGRIDDAFESQRRFIHEASHELRNPLAVIRTNVDVALAETDASPDDLRRTAEIVERSAARMTTLVDDLLVYARHGSRPERVDEVEVDELLTDLVAEFEAPTEARGIRIEVETEASTDGQGDDCVHGDGPAIRRALANLLANAVRLAPENSTVKVSSGAEDGWVWMAVADEGPGIDEADQPMVFQRFWRGPNGAGSEDGRSGLGLTIVRQIAEGHGGLVELTSSLGSGSNFVIWLPHAT